MDLKNFYFFLMCKLFFLYLPFLKDLRNHGYSVLSYDYEGYGLSTGKPTEDNTYRDVIATYNYATQKLHIPPKHIISMGHSLGAALAVYLADKKPTAGLILTSPFLSAFRVIPFFDAIAFPVAK